MLFEFIINYFIVLFKVAKWTPLWEYALNHGFSTKQSTSTEILPTEHMTHPSRSFRKGSLTLNHHRFVALCLTCIGFFLFGCPKVGSHPSPDHPGRVSEAASSQEYPNQVSTKGTNTDQIEDASGSSSLSLSNSYAHDPSSMRGAELPDAQEEAAMLQRFEEAQDLFDAGRFVDAREAFSKLIAQAPHFSKLHEARLSLTFCLIELGEQREAVRIAAASFFRFPEDVRRSLAKTLAPVAGNNGQFAEAARFSAELLETDRSPAERSERLAYLSQIIDTQLTIDELAVLSREIVPQYAAWPLFHFRHVLLQARLSKKPSDRPRHDSSEHRSALGQKTIGLLLPLSGRYAAFGKTVKLGVELAFTKSDIRLVTRDTAGDPLLARKAVVDLVEQEGAIALIGPVLSTEAPFAAVEAERLGVPLMSLTTNEDLPLFGDFIFRNMLTRSAQAKALADYAMGTLGYKTFAVIYPEFSYGTELAHAFWDEIERRGGQIRAAESYAIDQTTFRTQARKLVGRYYLEEREEFVKGRKEIDQLNASDFRKRKLKEDLLKKLEPIIDFDALLIPDTYQRVSLVAPALAVEDIITNACDRRDVERIAETAGKKPKDLKTVLLLGTDAWNFSELVERGGKFVQCSVFVDGFYVNANYEETRTFVSHWEQATQGKMPPLLLGAVSYDSARIMREIIERASPQSRAAMRSELLKIKNFPGACGPTGFDEDGELLRQLFLLTIDKDGIRELSNDPKS